MFLVTLPLAVVALYMAIRYVPAHVNETTETVDNLGGILSAVLIGAVDPRHQLRAGARTRGGSPSPSSPSRSLPGSRSSSASDAPQTRSTT